MKFVSSATILTCFMSLLNACTSAPVGNTLYEKRDASSLNLKIATLDVKKAIQSSKPGRQKKAELEKEFSDAKVRLDQQEKAVKTPEDRYQFKQSLATAQNKINLSEDQKVEPLLEYVRSIASKIAERDGFDKVVESEPRQGYPDLTEETLQALNKL